MPNQNMQLDGKVALVTGATRGIGHALALGLAGEGADVVAVSRHQEDCEKTAALIRETGRRALAVAADVTSLASVQNMVQTAVKYFGRIDILVNNAGTAMNKKAELLTAEDWDRVISVNLKGAFFCAQQVGIQMIAQRQGKIINIASILGLVGESFVLPYLVAKGGLIQMTRGLAVEWAGHNIQVNALCPGYIMTDMNREMLSDEKIYRYIINKTPARRLAQEKEIVGAVLFMASGASDYMTGSMVTVDGGWTAQ